MEKLIQITSGRGPLECQWVVAKVLKVFLEDAKNNKIDYEIIHRENGDENLTLKSVSVLLKGKTVPDFLEKWLGSICWTGKSTFRKLHKRSNWFIGILKSKYPIQLIFLKGKFSFRRQEVKEVADKTSTK